MGGAHNVGGAAADGSRAAAPAWPATPRPSPASTCHHHNMPSCDNSVHMTAWDWDGWVWARLVASSTPKTFPHPTGGAAAASL